LIDRQERKKSKKNVGAMWGIEGTKKREKNNRAENRKEDDDMKKKVLN